MERVTALHAQCPHFSTEIVLVAARLRCTQRAAAETNGHRDATGLFCTTCSPRRPCKQRMAARRPAIYGGRYQLADSRLLEDHRALSGCASELRRLGHAVDGCGGGQRILRHTVKESFLNVSRPGRYLTFVQMLLANPSAAFSS